MHLLVGRYVLAKQIGKGGFGAVEEYLDDITKESVAIKTIPSRYVNQESRRLVREIDIMCFLHEAHPHVIGYFNIFATRGAALPNHARPNDDPLASTAQTPDNTPYELNVLGPHYAGLSDEERLRLHHEELMKSVSKLARNDEFNVHIVMPLMKGDLFYFIRLLSSQSSVQRLGVTHQFLAQVAVVFAFQICFGLDYLHQCAIIHRDMKPDNVLVRLDINNPYMSTALIADMGLARDAQHSDTIYICTRYYRPPEVITSVSGGSTRIDIWSLGCIFYEICTGQTLFTMRTALNERGEWDGAKASLQLEVILNTIGTPALEDIERYMPKGNAKLYLQRSAPRPSQLRQMIERHWILHSSGDEKEKWIDLITRCVAFFPEQRPTAQQLCQHQLFRDYNVFYGSNVKQYAPTPYTPTFRSSPDSSRTENKQAILSLVSRALQETTPPENDDDSSSGEDLSSGSSSGSGSDTDSDDVHQPLPPQQPQHHHHHAHAHSHAGAHPPAAVQNNTHTNRDANEEGKAAASGVSSSSVSGSVSASRSAGAAAAPKHSSPPTRAALLPEADSRSAPDYGTGTFLDDDDDDEQQQQRQQQQHSRSARHKSINDDEGAEYHSPATLEEHQQAQQPSAYVPRYSPGNVFRTSPGGVPRRPAGNEPDRQFGRSLSSEEAGPVIDDTPPLAPALAFKDRITRRKQSAAVEDEEPSLGGARPSIFDLDNYRNAAAEKQQASSSGNEESTVPKSVVPQVAESLTAADAAAMLATYNIPVDRAETSPYTLTQGPQYNYGSQYPLSRTATRGPQLPSFYLGGQDGGGSSFPRPGGAGRRIADAGVHTVTTTTNNNTTTYTGNGQGNGGAPASSSVRRGGDDNQYDYFADVEYYMEPTTSNVGQLTKRPESSPYLLQLTGSGRADPLQPLRPQQAPQGRAPHVQSQPQPRQTATPTLPRVDSAAFPPIADAELRRRYMAYRHTPRSIQEATSAVLEELGGCTHDAERSSELRELLNYFTSLKVTPLYAI